MSIFWCLGILGAIWCTSCDGWWTFAGEDFRRSLKKVSFWCDEKRKWQTVVLGCKRHALGIPERGVSMMYTCPGEPRSFTAVAFNIICASRRMQIDFCGLVWNVFFRIDWGFCRILRTLHPRFSCRIWCNMWSIVWYSWCAMAYRYGAAWSIH